MSRESILRDFFETFWNQGDIDSADRFISAPYHIAHDPGDGWDGQTLSLEQYKERARTDRAPFPDQVFSIVDLFGDGDRIGVFWKWRGTHQADLGPFKASGKIIETSGATIYGFRSDQLCSHWQVVDRLSIMQQLSSGS